MQLFEEISFHIPKMHGWASLEKAHTLASITLALRPEVACELGIWGGRSLLPVAMTMRHLKFGVIIGIDPYSKEASCKDMEGANLEWWGNQDHEAMMNYFLRQVREHRVENHVHFMRKCSDEVEPPFKLDLLHVDGSHSHQAVKDVQRFACNVRKGGIAILDDIHWSGDGVNLAINTIKELGFVELYRVEKEGDDWAAFQRV